jgi:hypothetical protein
MDDLTAEHRRELESFGQPPRFDIRMIPLLGEQPPTDTVLAPATTPQRRDAVDRLGQQFRRELGFDFPPFDPDDPASQAVLILSRKFLATFPIAAGAAGLDHDGCQWTLQWIWLHPYERGTGLFTQAWLELEQRYGKFHLEGPYSPAIQAFIRSHPIEPHRLDQSND